jgi:hypothetical protein
MPELRRQKTPGSSSLSVSNLSVEIPKGRRGRKKRREGRRKRRNGRWRKP